MILMMMLDVDDSFVGICFFHWNVSCMCICITKHPWIVYILKSRKIRPLTRVVGWIGFNLTFCAAIDVLNESPTSNPKSQHGRSSRNSWKKCKGDVVKHTPGTSPPPQKMRFYDFFHWKFTIEIFFPMMIPKETTRIRWVSGFHKFVSLMIREVCIQPSSPTYSFLVGWCLRCERPLGSKIAMENTMDQTHMTPIEADTIHSGIILHSWLENGGPGLSRCISY